MASLRAFAKWANRSSILFDYSPPKAKRPTPHPISEGIEGVVRMCRNAKSPNEAALFALQGLMGLRVSEALSVMPQDFNEQDMTLTVRGKGDKERELPIPTMAWKYIRPAYMFAQESGRTVVDMPDRTARHRITATGKRLGFDKRIKSHDLRSTLATALYDNTLDLRATQEVLGHASSRTTEMYTQVTMKTMRAGLDSLNE